MIDPSRSCLTAFRGTWGHDPAPTWQPCSGGGGVTQDGPFGHDQVKSGGNIAEPRQAGRAVAGRFVALRLRLGDTEGVGKARWVQPRRAWP